MKSILWQWIKVIFIKTNTSKLGRIIENKYNFVKFWIKHDFFRAPRYVVRTGEYILGSFSWWFFLNKSMAVWQWRLRTTQWRDTTFSCPIKRLCYRKLTLKNCTLPTVCSWGCRLQSHFSSRLLSESEWRQQRGRADFFLSASISDRPKRPKQPLIIKPLAKKVTKTRCATTFFPCS